MDNERYAGRRHPPPPNLAIQLRMQPCTASCDICLNQGCVKCPACCMNVSARHGLTLVIGRQAPNTPMAHQAFYLIDGEFFPLKSTFCAIFDGRTVLHGLYGPAVPKNSYWHIKMVMTPDTLNPNYTIASGYASEKEDTE